MEHYINMSPEVSVVIPALNEEKTIALCIKHVREGCEKAGISYEIVVVDSSTDATSDIAESLGARVIHPELRGYGHAYLTGFEHAKGSIVVIGDADNTYDFRVIPDLIKPIQEGAADMVIGSRMSGTLLPGAMPALHKYIGNPLLTRLLNFAFSTRFSDCHSGFRAIDMKALKKLSLHTGGMEFASEMMIEAARKNLQVAEIPITYYPRDSPSNLHSFADGWRHVRFIMLMRPLPFLMAPGFVFTLLGLFLMIVLFMTRPVEYISLHSFILGAIFLTGGVQLLMMGFALKAYAITHGFDEAGPAMMRVLRYQSLEAILFTGCGLLVIGALAGIWVLYEWISHEYGSLSQVTNAVLVMCSVILGLQFIFTAILVSMMVLSGERDEI
jgi:glycosyltransferase involved in cell wall biosynthesis